MFRRSSWLFSPKDFHRLYKDELVKINPIERIYLFYTSSFGILSSPASASQLATMSEMFCKASLINIYEQMRSDKVGREILLNKPLVCDKEIDFESLKSLPDGTLGKEYISFMTKYKFHADEREPVHFVDNEELAYVMTRYRQLHDFSHVLFGLNINIECEIALKYIEFIQTKLLMTGLASILGWLATPVIRIKRQIDDKTNLTFPRSKMNDAIHYVYCRMDVESKENQVGAKRFLFPRRVLFQELLPWAGKVARMCYKPMHLIYVERLLDQQIDDVRKAYGIQLPPANIREYTDMYE